VGRHAGANRTKRALLRATQLGGSAAYALTLVSLLLGSPAWLWGGALGLVAAAKLALQARHAVAVRFSAGEWLGFAALQPALDVAFTAGILEGFWQLARGGARPID
jgi:hypothetical protein